MVSEVLLSVSVRGSPSWCVPRNSVIVLTSVIVVVCRSALPEGQIAGSTSIGWTNTDTSPDASTHVVMPFANVQVEPGGGQRAAWPTRTPAGRRRRRWLR
jgi:hypothetical protein